MISRKETRVETSLTHRSCADQQGGAWAPSTSPGLLTICGSRGESPRLGQEQPPSERMVPESVDLPASLSSPAKKQDHRVQSCYQRMEGLSLLLVSGHQIWCICWSQVLC